MKITEPDAKLREAAIQGDLAALDRLLALVQPGIYNLAVRMLGNRDDAADATQEILLKLVTHLGSFRGEAAFSTWVWRIARNHLLTANTRSAESPEVSLEGMAERLQAGLDFVDTVLHASGRPMPITPQDRLEARQVALGCTQNMLMTLTRDQRLAYVLDAFTGQTCGLANPQARCHCERQLPALRHLGAGGQAKAASVVPLHRSEQQEAERAFSAFTRVGDAAALFRAHPAYQAPDAMRSAVRAVLTQEGFLDPGTRQ